MASAARRECTCEAGHVNASFAEYLCSANLASINKSEVQTNACAETFV